MRIGLVLSGGIAKGAYEIGILKAFREFLPKDYFCCISTSSIGVLNGYAYITDQLDTAEKTWKNLEFDGVLGFVRSFSKSSYVDSLMDCLNTANQQIDTSFYIVSLSVPYLCLTYTNIAHVPASKHIDYLNAGIALPPFRKPVTIKGARYIDGAMVDNIPTLPLLSRNMDLVIVVYFDKDNYLFENQEFNGKVIRITFPEQKVIRDSFSFSENSVSSMISKGYEGAKNIIFRYQLNHLSDINRIYAMIDDENKLKPKHSLRITGDMLVNNFNVLSKKLVRYKVLEEGQGSLAPRIQID